MATPELAIQDIVNMALHELEAATVPPELRAIALSKIIDLVVVRETRGLTVSSSRQQQLRRPQPAQAEVLSKTS